MEADDWVKLLATTAVAQVIALVVTGIGCYVKLAVLQSTVDGMKKSIDEYDATHEKLRADISLRGEAIWREISKLRDRVTRLEPRGRRHEPPNGDESCA